MKATAAILCALYLTGTAECLLPFLLPDAVRRSAATGEREVRRLTAAAGEPLLLTPLIDAGKTTEARTRSAVSLMAVEGNAGFLTVNRTANANLYFWLCRKTAADWTRAPVVLWLEGGPGCSSLFSLFAENGPLRVLNGTLQRRRRYAWTDRFNVLYVDQPVGAGFSFADHEDGYSSSQPEVGEHLYEALTQFYKLFPELRENAFYVAGESYAGKYIPAVGYAIHRRNQLPRADQIPLKGMLIGNGWSDPVNMLGYGEYLHRLGLVDHQKRREADAIQRRIRVLIRGEEWLKAKQLSDELFTMLYDCVMFGSVHDYTRDDVRGDFSFVDFLEREDVREAIHVGGRAFELYSLDVYRRFQVDIMKSVKPWIEELLEHYPMVFYSGQLDILVPYPLSEKFLQNLRWSAADVYSSAERRVWRAGAHVVGYYKRAGHLVDVLVRNAGHLVALDQPRYTWELLVKFVEGEL